MFFEYLREHVMKKNQIQNYFLFSKKKKKKKKKKKRKQTFER